MHVKKEPKVHRCEDLSESQQDSLIKSVKAIVLEGFLPKNSYSLHGPLSHLKFFVQ